MSYLQINGPKERCCHLVNQTEDVGWVFRDHLECIHLDRDPNSFKEVQGDQCSWETLYHPVNNKHDKGSVELFGSDKFW